MDEWEKWYQQREDDYHRNREAAQALWIREGTPVSTWREMEQEVSRTRQRWLEALTAYNARIDYMASH